MALLISSVTFDPHGSAFAGVSWIERLVVGPLGASLAVIAVAWFGLVMLSGRLSLKRGGLLLLGCFILSSAPIMARALLGFSQQTSGGATQIQPQEIVVPPPRALPSPPNYDPYAGASVPDGD